MKRSGRRPPLTLAGSDPTAGAGLEADLLVFGAFGLHGVAVATALTEQDTRGVAATNPVPPRRVAARLATLLADVPIAGLKIGLLPSTAHARIALRAIEAYTPGIVVLDPVLRPTRGPAFLDRHGVAFLRDELLPRVDLVTPNLAEAARLLGRSAAAVARSPERALADLRRLGAPAVLLKGGHGGTARSADLLDDGGALREFALPRLRGKRGDVHGTGCALAAAILAGRIRGASLAEATAEAKRFVYRAIAGAAAIGRGRLRLDLLGDHGPGRTRRQ